MLNLKMSIKFRKKGWDSLNFQPVKQWKDIMHVRAAISFQAEALDVELAGQFDEVVVTLHMFQLTVVALQKDMEKAEVIRNKKGAVEHNNYICPSMSEWLEQRNRA